MKTLSSKFNKAYSRIAFWHSLSSTLSHTVSMMHEQAALTPDDVKALNTIRKALSTCRSTARQRYTLHRERFDTLRKEIINER